MKSAGLLTKQSLFIFIALLFTASFAVSLWLAFYLPVYDDETAWKLFSSRLFVDNGKLVYLFAQCNQGYWLNIPLTWYPLQWLDSMLYGDASNPVFLRTVGWFFFIALMGSWVVIFRSISKLSWQICSLIVVAFFSFGVTPFIMVFNRPEQPLLIWLTVLLLMSLWFDSHPLKTYFGKVMLTAAFALISCLIAATHPKGLFFFPLVLFAWWRCVKWWPASLPLLGVMVLTAYETKHIWYLRTACEEFPGLSTMLKSLTLRPNQLWQEPFRFIDGVTTNLQNSTQYVSQMAINKSYISDWLPSVETAFNQSSIAWVSQFIIWLPILFVSIIILLNIAQQTTKPRGVYHLLIAVFLMLLLMVIMSFQTAKNFYESALIWPLLLLVALFTFKGLEQAWSKRFISWTLPILLLASVLSGFVRYELFSTSVKTWQQTQVNGKIVNIEALQRFAKSQCNIQATTPNLALGFLAYAAFYQHPKPIFLTYSSGWWGAEANFAQTMSKRAAGGLVARCKDIPEETKILAKQQGQFCCVSGSDLRNLINLQPNQR